MASGRPRSEEVFPQLLDSLEALEASGFVRPETATRVRRVLDDCVEGQASKW